ncbi:cytochrome c [Mangrovibacterium sp.]|uniref:c-type cytochrome n=1 Tax=Mangrovibacterium sp. TaxID=1961364 RepID=UPI00356209A0
MKLKKGIKLLLAIVVVASLSSCDHSRNNPGWQYFDDMVTSPAYESYTSNPNFADGKTMHPTVEGTVPRGFMRYPFEKTDEDRVKAGLTFQNYVEPTTENLERGKEVYTIYCSSCHGEKGDGMGHLFTSKKFQYPPASLLSEKVRAIPDGEIYHVISVGWGIMAEHGTMMKPDDRWKAVLYIRNELQNN